MLSVLFLLSSIPLFSQQEWTWSIHPEAHFKVLAPMTLTHSVRELPTAYEPILYHQYNGGSVADSPVALAFVIDHYRLPLPSDSTDYLYNRQLFENTIEELLSALDGELTYMDFIGDANRDVCVWKAAYRHGQGVIRGNLIIAGDQYYGLQVFGLTKNNPETLMNKFLDSFKIIN